VLGWAALVITAVLVGGLLALTAAREWAPRAPFDPEGAGSDGARAIVRLLTERLGVAVEPVDAREEALGRVDDGTTLVVGDTFALDDDQLAELAGAQGDLVLLAPSARDLRVLFDSAFTSYGHDAVEGSCDLPVASLAGAIVPGETYLPGSAETVCYPVDDGYALLRTENGHGAVTALDARALLVNERLAENGNAALGLGLLAESGRVVWYLPSLEEATGSGVPATLGDLTPGWVTPAIVVLAAAGIAAGVWRGRRFGPLVAESLPVTVRASETLEGRARLYSRAADPEHAAELLRAGAAGRLARLLGLPGGASPSEVADAAAARLGAPPQDVRDILLASPTTDAELVSRGERLRDLEAAVSAAVHSERTTL
jgi:hypothetical protein